ncbi:MAG: hypothetical protein H6702_09085 [Myxococcales bacterium]|nr:hypothetical protein [Myxococcales bacterium]
MSSTESPLKAWWGPHALPPPGEGLHWRIGPLSLWVRAWPGGWSVHCADSGDPVDEALIVAEPGLAPPEADRIRLASERLGGTVVLGARCPDRVIAVRPEIALTVLPGDRVTLFVGTAVWLTLGTEAGEVVHELPVYRPTDSWLGPDTRSGILAYAGARRPARCWRICRRGPVGRSPA